MKRSSAFLVNGGAGRIICSIPAFEKYEEENLDDDFIIVVEYGIDFFKGHRLYRRCYDFAHKNLFQDKIKDRNFIFPEPYQVWEYYNQKASISQAFDIAINNKGIRSLPKPSLMLSNDELFGGMETVNNIKKDRGNKKVIVFQPFGRGSNFQSGKISFDIFGKSFFIEDVVNIVEKLQKQYIVILMTEETINFDQLNFKNINVAQISGLNLRKWTGIINAADYFLGCDSVGQHIAYSLEKKATIVLGGTFKENVSYPNCGKFNIIDLGEDRRQYSPIRLCYDESADLVNEKIMRLNPNQITEIINSVNKNI